MDYMGGHLLADRFARLIVAGPYTEDSFEDDTDTPSKEPKESKESDKQPGGLAPPKPLPTKPTPRGIPPRPDVPMLMEPQSLQVQRQPLMPGEMPAEFLPGENGRPAASPSMMSPPRMPGMMPPPQMPGMMQPQRMRAPPMPGMSPPSRNNAPPMPGLKKSRGLPSIKAPKPVSQSPAQKPPHQQMGLYFADVTSQEIVDLVLAFFEAALAHADRFVIFGDAFA
jgi:hypothetical protein